MKIFLLIVLQLFGFATSVYYIIDENKKVFEYLFGDEQTLASLTTFPLCYNDGINFEGESVKVNTTMEEYVKLLGAYNSSFLNLTFTAKIYQITEVNERAQSVSMLMGIELSWIDCRLSWADEESTAPSIELPPKKFKDMGVFVPTILFLESTDPTAGRDSETRTTIYKSGEVQVCMEFSTVMSCDINVEMYPFDMQICNLTFETTMSSEAVNLKYAWMNESIDIESIFLLGVDRFIPSDTWDVIFIPPTWQRLKSCVDPDDPQFDTAACLTDRLTYKLILHRHPTYQLVNLMVPAFLVVVISSFVFVIPPNSEDKMNLSVTILLSMFVFTQLMYSKMPETGSSLPLMSEFFMVCVALVAASCLYSAVSAVLANASTPVPLFLQSFARVLGPWLLVDMIQRSTLRKNTKSAAQGNSNAKGLDQLRKPEESEKSAEDENHDSEEGMHIDALHGVNWHACAALLDRCFFVIHFLICVTVLLAFISWGYGSWNADYFSRLTETEREYARAQHQFQQMGQD